MPLLQMTGSDAQKWAEMRGSGRRSHVLTRGLGWGAFMFVALGTWALIQGEMSLTWLVVNAVLWTIGGLGFGWVTWPMNERLFRAREEGAV